MSASEQLAALLNYNDDTDRICMACHTNYTMLDRLTAVLPEIVAVVQWAERFSNFGDYHGWTNKEHPRLEPELDAALAALAEKLGGGK